MRLQASDVTALANHPLEARGRLFHTLSLQRPISSGCRYGRMGLDRYSDFIERARAIISGCESREQLRGAENYCRLLIAEARGRSLSFWTELKKEFNAMLSARAREISRRK